MNKFHYLAAVALSAMTLASCSNDEVVSSLQNSKAISFDAMANKTGRSEVMTNNITRFRVYGCVTDNKSTDNHTVIFNNITVERPSTSSLDWSYTNQQYWAPNKDYYFVALSTNVMDPKWKFTAPETHDGALAVGETFKGYGSVSMNVAEVNAENDLVYAYASRATDAEITDATKVKFSFNHMLSRLGLKFTNAIESNGYTIHIRDISIGGVASTGTVTLGVDPANLAWTMGETTSITATVPDNNIIDKTQSTTSASKFIIPGNQAMTISFNVDIMLNGTAYSSRSMTGKIAAQDYKPGCSYMLNANISMDNIIPGGAKPIEFEVIAVNGWGDDNDGEITID